MENTKNTATCYAAGFLEYFLMYWIFAFYPAFILSLSLGRLFYGLPQTLPQGFETHWEARFLSLFFFIIFTLAIVVLFFLEKYEIVIFLYVITAWPFLCILGHWCYANNHLMIDSYPVPLDWCPFW